MIEREPIPVQGSLGIVADRKIVLAPRASLARLLQPSQWSVDQESFEGLTPRAIEAADPRNFVPDLINVIPGSVGAVSYPDAEQRRDIWVGLTPTEYTMVSRSPLRQARQAEQRSLAKGSAVAYQSGRMERSARAGAHSLESAVDRMTAYTHNVLEPRAVLLGKFATAVQYPGLSLFGSEIGFRMRMGEYQGMVDDMLQVLEVKRQWKPEQLSLARKAIYWRILMDRDDNRHIGNFQELTDLLALHNGAKLAAFRSKTHESRQLIRQRVQ